MITSGSPPSGRICNAVPAGSNTNNNSGNRQIRAGYHAQFWAVHGRSNPQNLRIGECTVQRFSYTLSLSLHYSIAKHSSRCYYTKKHFFSFFF